MLLQYVGKRKNDEIGVSFSIRESMILNSGFRDKSRKLFTESVKILKLTESFVNWVSKNFKIEEGLVAELEIDLHYSDENGRLAYGKILTDLKKDYLMRHPKI